MIATPWKAPTMNRLKTSLLLGLLCFATSDLLAQSCKHAVVTVSSVTCRCTGLRYNTGTCQTSTDPTDRCTIDLVGDFCGSNGTTDCYVGAAYSGCIAAPTRGTANRGDVLELASNHVDQFWKSESAPATCASASRTWTEWQRTAARFPKRQERYQ